MREIAWTPVWDADRRGWGVELVRVHERHATGAAILFDEDGVPFELSYRIEWDDRWAVRRVAAETRRRDAHVALHLVSDGAGAWQDGEGVALPHFQGCIDIDVWPTPFTNTFPIRRLDLRPGERAEIDVVYIQAPALRASVERQAYRRLDASRYLFESNGGAFRAELPVDGDGLVVDYPGLFRRLADGGS